MEGSALQEDLHPRWQTLRDRGILGAGQHQGRRETFALGSNNAEAAASKAKTIATFLEANGWDATRAKFKPSRLESAETATLGEFLEEVKAKSHLKPITIRRYAVKLRKIIGDLANVGAKLKGKALRKKYDYRSGGHHAWNAEIDRHKLSLLTPESLTEWRNAYVAKAGNDPLKRKSAERSAASCLRCARALFSPEIINLFKIKLPPNPFQGVKIIDPGPQRYVSDVNPDWLLVCAERELRQQDPQAYLGLILCLWAGLRRKEADLLTWAQVDFASQVIQVRRTPYFEPKTEESQRNVDLPRQALDRIKTYMAKSQSEFVMDGNEPNIEATYDYYRCDHTWRRLTEWLRAKGIRQVKAVHALRKESGSLVASEFGIEAARQHLGHRDISTTSSHYVAKKRRVEIEFRSIDTGPSEQSSGA